MRPVDRGGGAEDVFDEARTEQSCVVAQGTFSAIYFTHVSSQIFLGLGAISELNTLLGVLNTWVCAR